MTWDRDRIIEYLLGEYDNADEEVYLKVKARYAAMSMAELREEIERRMAELESDAWAVWYGMLGSTHWERRFCA